MRLYKVVILVVAAFCAGLLAGYLWWSSEVTRLRAAVLAGPASERESEHAPPTRWVVQGIVRGVLPDEPAVVVTHEALSGLMGAMTMPLTPASPGLLAGLAAGQRVELTLDLVDGDLVLVDLR